MNLQIHLIARFQLRELHDRVLKKMMPCELQNFCFF